MLVYCQTLSLSTSESQIQPFLNPQQRGLCSTVYSILAVESIVVVVIVVEHSVCSVVVVEHNLYSIVVVVVIELTLLSQSGAVPVVEL